jgi:hypothetical protein
VSGDLAQLVERMLSMYKVTRSIRVVSTSQLLFFMPGEGRELFGPYPHPYLQICCCIAERYHPAARLEALELAAEPLSRRERGQQAASEEGSAATVLSPLAC